MVSQKSALAIDVGLDTLAMCVTGTDGSLFFIDGKPVKSINHQFNGCLAQWQSILDLQKLPRSEQMARITMTRNDRVHDYMMKATLIHHPLLPGEPHRDRHRGISPRLEARHRSGEAPQPELCTNPPRTIWHAIGKSVSGTGFATSSRKNPKHRKRVLICPLRGRSRVNQKFSDKQVG